MPRLLDKAATFRGSAGRENGNETEFINRSTACGSAHGVRHIFTQPDRPMQSGSIKSFKGQFRDERLNEKRFLSFPQSRQCIAEWG